MRNLLALCQRCHILHDRPHHLVQRWITYRRRLATGDLFLGPYSALIAELTSTTPTAVKRTTGSLWAGQHSKAPLEQQRLLRARTAETRTVVRKPAARPFGRPRS
jgi:hypothetical protein